MAQVLPGIKATASEDESQELAIPFGPGLRPLEIAVGQMHACAILADYTHTPVERGVKCWGSRQNGLLGQETASYGFLSATDLENERFLNLVPETDEK